MSCSWQKFSSRIELDNGHTSAAVVRGISLESCDSHVDTTKHFVLPILPPSFVLPIFPSIEENLAPLTGYACCCIWVLCALFISVQDQRAHDGEKA